MPHEIQVLQPQRVRNRVYHLVGLAIMAANQVRHRVRGYRTPRPSSVVDANGAFEYDRAVVENWLAHLGHYTGEDPDVSGKHVLELGPGPDLGTGLFLLARGAATYTAVDAHPLVERTPAEVHRSLAVAIAEHLELPALDRARLLELAENPLEDPEGRISYHYLPDFNLSRLPTGSYDLVLSHSALEHLEDVPRTLRQISALMRHRARLVAEIDLQTHTRWIRNADPLNIYRYRRSLYRSLGFSGSPNRVRPDEYVNTLESEGWSNFRMYPRRVLAPEYVTRVEPTLNRRFRGDPEHLGWLSVVLCATRKGEKLWKERGS